MVRFQNIGKANAEIERLEDELHRLGGPAPTGTRTFHILRANEQIESLEAQIARFKGSNSAPKPLPPRATPAASPQKAIPVANHSSSAAHRTKPMLAPYPRSHLLKLAAVFPAIKVSDTISDMELWSAIEKNAFQSFIEIPGMSSPAELAARYYRMELTGLRRTIGASRHETIRRILG